MKLMLLLMTIVWITVWGFLGMNFTEITGGQLAERNARIELLMGKIK